MSIFGSDGSVFRKSGKTTFVTGKNSETLHRSGSTTFGRNGQAMHKAGNTSYTNSGTIRKSGNTYYIGGQAYLKAGNTLYGPGGKVWHGTGNMSDDDARSIIFLDTNN